MNKSIIAQLKTLTPASFSIGGLCGALVPVGTNYVAHSLLHGDLLKWSVLPFMVLGGLIFSCLSVYAFSRSVFGSWYKALGFVVAIEGYMTFTDGWLSTTALVFLVVINAIANGCRVATERQAELAAVEPVQAVETPVVVQLLTAVESLAERVAKLETPVQTAPVAVTSTVKRIRKPAQKRSRKVQVETQVEASN